MPFPTESGYRILRGCLGCDFEGAGLDSLGQLRHIGVIVE